MRREALWCCTFGGSAQQSPHIHGKSGQARQDGVTGVGQDSSVLKRPSCWCPNCYLPAVCLGIGGTFFQGRSPCLEYTFAAVSSLNFRVSEFVISERKKCSVTFYLSRWVCSCHAVSAPFQQHFQVGPLLCKKPFPPPPAWPSMQPHQPPTAQDQFTSALKLKSPATQKNPSLLSKPGWLVAVSPVQPGHAAMSRPSIMVCLVEEETGPGPSKVELHCSQVPSTVVMGSAMLPQQLPRGPWLVRLPTPSLQSLQDPFPRDRTVF